MNKTLLLIAICLLTNLFSSNGQCIDTLPANTIIITSDTVITNNNGSMSNYLICPGAEVTYSGQQSVFNKYYLEENSLLILNSYHYPQLYMKATAEVNAQHSISPQSLLMNSYVENGAIFTDTVDAYTSNITTCNPLIFNYSNLPGGVGCPANPCIEILPANTIIITADTTISTLNGMANYLICPGVDVNYTGGQSTFVNYYLEEGASLNVGNYHYPQVFVQSSAEVIANHSSGFPSYLMNPVAEIGAIFTDTSDNLTGNVTWCSTLIFDYSNLPGGIGCPVLTNLNKISHTTAIKVYPNPANTFIYIDNIKIENHHKVVIQNSLGQVVLQQAILQKKQFIDLGSWDSKGFYFLSILGPQNELIEVHKIILE